jgi:hypothetical protein
VALALTVAPPDTLRIRTLDHSPPAGRADTLAWGPPQVRLAMGAATASIWVLRAADTLFVAAVMPDDSPSWADAFAICVDAWGDAGSSPGHDDFQWSFQRTLDSSVVFRGRNGRWEPPRADPDWRLGTERSGGGWEVSGASDAKGWLVLLRLDPAWLEGQGGRRPAVAFRVHDDDPNGWFSWPAPTTSAGALLVERTPALWIPLEQVLP